MTNQVKIKRKATSAERLMFVGLSVLTVASLFFPWATSYSREENIYILMISDNCFLAFVDNLFSSSSMMWDNKIEFRFGVIVTCSILLLPLFLLVIITGLGGWRKFLLRVSRLTGVCACLMTFLSVGYGEDKLIGFYITMLCGIALVALSFKDYFAAQLASENDTSENNGEQQENAATVTKEEEPYPTMPQTVEHAKVATTGKKKKPVLFIAIGGIVALIFILVWAKTNSSGNPADCSLSGAPMTMTFSPKGKVSILLAGSGAATIDWGDGSAHEEHTLSLPDKNGNWQNNKSKYTYSHTYSGTSIRTITITGDNIVIMECEKLGLSHLDVSCNTALSWLICPENQLTELDVSKNVKLEVLDCTKNQLKRLDVSKNTLLVYLICNDNQLRSLDISKNPAMVYLGCINNQLKSLDVSNNTELTELYCFGNQIPSVDVSRNTKLKQFMQTQ